MFNVSEYLDSDYKNDCVKEKIGSETFLIRKLNGYERLRLQDVRESSQRIVNVLAQCLLDGKTKQPIGEENARKFIARYDALSNAVASRIFRLTVDAVNAEEAAWGLAEKNSPETSGSEDTASTAVDTG